MIQVLIVFTLMLVAVTAHLVAWALRDEYLLLLRWPWRGTWLFERSPDGRYHRLRYWHLPSALVRYASGSRWTRALAWTRG